MSVDWDPKLLPQSEQRKFRSPVCTTLWTLNCCANANCFPHTLHSNGFSPKIQNAPFELHHLIIYTTNLCVSCSGVSGPVECCTPFCTQSSWKAFPPCASACGLTTLLPKGTSSDIPPRGKPDFPDEPLSGGPGIAPRSPKAVDNPPLDRS